MNRECVRVVSVCVCVDSLRITSSQSAPTAWFASCHNVRLAGVGLPVSRAVADDDRRGKQSAVVNCFARSMIVSSLNDSLNDSLERSRAASYCYLRSRNQSS